MKFLMSYKKLYIYNPQILICLFEIPGSPWLNGDQAILFVFEAQWKLFDYNLYTTFEIFLAISYHQVIPFVKGMVPLI